MKVRKKTLILIVHGGFPNDIAKEVIKDFMKIHKHRMGFSAHITSKGKDLESIIRNWLPILLPGWIPFREKNIRGSGGFSPQVFDNKILVCLTL